MQLLKRNACVFKTTIGSTECSRKAFSTGIDVTSGRCEDPRVLVCPHCGEENPDRARFCLSCGRSLAAETPTGEERKVVSVLFVDLVEFTNRSDRADPEDVRATLRPYHERVKADIERFGGTVEKFIGDAVMAVFGAPVAHEDDPERAVRAALAIREWMTKSSDELQVRIGVNTGEALVSLGARAHEGEGIAAGDVVNTAARIQTGAAVNAILVGEQTYRATHRVFEFREAEPVVAKGKSDPITVWEPLRARARVGVDDLDEGTGPLVGRQRELELLTSVLARVREEHSPQLVTIVGVPGIGKSRLVRELSQHVEADAEHITWRRGRSLPYGDGVTYWALAEIVKAQSGILESDSSHEAAAKLGRAVSELAADEAEAQWLEFHLRPLLGIGGESRSGREDDQFTAWRRFLEALAEPRPLVLVFEDLHWADEALLDFVDELVDYLSDVAVFVLGTARPELLERRAGWSGGKPNALTLSLPPLSEDASARLLASLLDRPVIAAEEQRTLLARIGGNPLYAEQYARALVERGDLDELPETVQGIIAARLDGLSPDEKRLLQDAAVVGQVFWLGSVVAIGGLASDTAVDALRRLERKQFVQRSRRSSVADDVEYVFGHALLRDVAYGQMPRSARGEKHRRAVDWLEALGRPEDHAEMLAFHYKSALDYLRPAGQADPSLVERASAALRLAGDRAAALAAYSTAARSYETALDLLPTESHERATLMLRLGRTYFSADSTGGDELEAALDAFIRVDDPEGAAEAALGLRMIAWYEGDGDRANRWLGQALELVEDRPDSAAKAEVLVVRASFHSVAGEHELALRYGRESLPLVERMGLDVLRARLLVTIGTSRVSLGDADGIGDLEAAVELTRALSAFAPLHAATNNLADALFTVGKVSEAVSTYEELLESIERFGRDTDKRWARASMASLWACVGRWDDALRLADGYIAEIDAGSPHYLEPPCRVTRASIREARGDLDGATADSDAALAAGRLAEDAQVFAPALLKRAVLLHAEGRQAEADGLVTELFTLEDKLGPSMVTSFGGLAELAWLVRDLGRGPELLDVLKGAPTIPWESAARAIVTGDFESAIGVHAEIGATTSEAFIRLRTAAELAAAGQAKDAERHLDAALGFYAGVGASRFIDEGERIRASIRGPAAETAERLG